MTVASPSDAVDRARTASGIAAYWAHHLVVVVTALWVSPIAVRELGLEAYGVWTVFVAVAGWMAVLDLGLNVALVRRIAGQIAIGDRAAAGQAFAACRRGLNRCAAAALLLSLFGGAAVLVVLPVAPAMLLGVVAGLVAIDVAVGVAGSAFLSLLTAVHRLPAAYGLGIVVAVGRAVAFVIALRSGGGLLAVAAIQLTGTVLRHAGHVVLARRFARDLVDGRHAATVDASRGLFAEGRASVPIALANRLLGTVDSLVVGNRVALGLVGCYSLPASLFDHAGRLALAASAVLAPRVSAQATTGAFERTRELYAFGVRAAMFALVPVLFELAVVGDVFLQLWLGEEFAQHGGPVLRVLAVGAFVALPQRLAQGVLEGLGRQRRLGLVLMLQVAANLVLSVWLAHDFGLVGVALGTAIPQIVVHGVLVPGHVCREIGLSRLAYVRTVAPGPMVALVCLAALHGVLGWRPGSWSGFTLHAAGAVVVTLPLFVLWGRRAPRD